MGAVDRPQRRAGDITSDDDRKAQDALREAHHRLRMAIIWAESAGWGGNIVQDMRDTMRNVERLRADAA